MTWVGVELHRAVTPRSWQGHLKVTSRSNQHKGVKIAYFCCFCSIEISMIVETQLATNNELYQTYPNRLQGWYRVWRGYTPANHPYVTPVWNSKNWPNNKTMAMFRPMVNTSILCEEIQPKYTWGHGFRMYFSGVKVQTVYTCGPKGWGWALESCYPKVISRSQQGHSKVKSIQKYWIKHIFVVSAPILFTWDAHGG